MGHNRTSPPKRRLPLPPESPNATCYYLIYVIISRDKRVHNVSKEINASIMCQIDLASPEPVRCRSPECGDSALSQRQHAADRRVAGSARPVQRQCSKKMLSQAG